MAVTSETSTATMAGDGSAVAIPTGFVFASATDLVVTRTVSGSTVTLTNGVDYTVTGGSGSTGTVTMTTAPAVGATITVKRSPPLTQTTSFVTHGSFSPTLHENALDKLTQLVQHLSYRLGVLEASTGFIELIEAIEDDAALLALINGAAQRAQTNTFDLLQTFTTGITSAVFRSSTANPASAGAGRLARADTIGWRNQANDADVALGVDASNNLEWGGADLATPANTIAFTNKTVQDAKDPTRAYAKATHSAGASIANNTVTIVDFANTVLDSRTAITTGASWKYTVPTGHAGVYLVSAVATFNTGTAGPMELSLYKNGSVDTRLCQLAAAGSTAAVSLSGATLISLAAADYVDIRILQVSGGARSLVNSGQYNHISIVRLLTDL